MGTRHLVTQPHPTPQELEQGQGLGQKGAGSRAGHSGVGGKGGGAGLLDGGGMRVERGAGLRVRG